MSHATDPPAHPPFQSDWLAAVPRLELGFLPTPLVPLDRLSARLEGPRIWLKRDDCTGLATGGNKTRKLEYLLAEAKRAGADRIVTFGAVQSNHARQTAAACAALGLPCHLLLTRRVLWAHPAYENSGNILFDRLFDADVEILAPEAVGSRLRERLEAWRATGGNPYVIPTGGSNAIGALGYARCALELLEQSTMRGFELTDIVHASSSAGTQAGLVAGFTALLPPAAARPAVHGINVYERDPARLAANVVDIARALLANHGPDSLRRDPAAAIDARSVRVDGRFLGEDYGIPTAATVAAIRLLAGTEGILMDPVYSGKAFGGLIARVHAGEFAHATDVVFVHTGGTAALPVYDDAFA